MNYFFQENIIGLASKSPRRKQLMEDGGFKVQIIESPGEEEYPDLLKPDEVPSYLATQKALRAIPFMDKNRIILAADTIVVLNNKIMGKPKSRQEAEEMLTNLSDGTHSVLTGVCILIPPFKKVFAVESIVSVGPLDKKEIDFYIEQFKPFDKAGSYGIQEWFGVCQIKNIQGSYTNVMGLPMYEVYHALEDMLTKGNGLV